jgi:hypothetical protein
VPAPQGHTVGRVSRRSEVATRVSPGAQLAQVSPSEPPAAGCCGEGVVQGKDATAAGAHSNRAGANSNLMCKRLEGSYALTETICSLK